MAERCNGCRICEIACSLKHEGVIDPTMSRIQVISDIARGVHIPLMCQHCEKPVCKDVCPVGAISRNPETGAIQFDPEICIGCRICIVACPFGGPVLDREKGIVVTCDLCDGDPYCVKFCGREAIRYVRSDTLGYVQKSEGIKKLSDLLTLITPRGA